MTHHGYIGRCPRKGCKHAERQGRGNSYGQCPEHGTYRLTRLWGVVVASVKCGARCQGAVGPSCDCSCGGANHGIAHGAAA